MAVQPGITHSDHFALLKNQILIKWVADTLSHASVKEDWTYFEPASIKLQAAAVDNQNTSPSQQIDYVEGRVNPGQQAQVSMPADGLAALRFISASDRGGLKTTLRSPGGTLIDPASATGNSLITYTAYADPATTAALVIYEIRQPESGDWTVLLDGATTAPQAIGYSLEAHGDSWLTLTPTTAKNFVPGQPVMIGCTLRTLTAAGVTSVTGSTVRAIVTRPDSTQTTLTLTDDSLNGDELAGDGIYGGMLGGALAGGDYRVRYRAEGVNPENGLNFRRMANGSLTVSPGGGFIAGELQAEGVTTTASGMTDFIRLQLVVDVATSGTYSVSAELVDEAGGARLAAAQTVTRPEPGASTVSLYFDRRGLPAAATAGPFHLENLQLYRMDEDRLIWLDCYQSAFVVKLTLYGPPTTDQIVQNLLGKNTLDMVVLDVNGDGRVDIADVIANCNAGR